MGIQPLQHLLVNLLDVCELAPAGNVSVLLCALGLVNEFFHQRQLVVMPLPEVLLANISRLLLAVFWFRGSFYS
jgi:cell division protein FtsL